MPITLTPPEMIDATARRAYDWACLAPEEKRGKFFLSSVADERVVAEMREMVAEAMREGISEQEFVHRALPRLAELTDPDTGRPYYDPGYWTSLTPEEALRADRDVTQLDSVARLRLIYRTQSELAAGRRRWEEDTDPARIAAFPAWRFVRQPGAKTKRPDHVEHEGEVRLIADTDYWLARNSPEFGGFNQPFPPWGFNSWMRCFPVSRAECERLGLLAPGEPAPGVPAATRARYTLPDALAAANAAALSTLPPESVSALTEDCRALGIELRPLPNSTTTTTTVPLRDPVGEIASLLELAALHRLLLPLFRKLTAPAQPAQPAAPKAAQQPTKPTPTAPKPAPAPAAKPTPAPAKNTPAAPAAAPPSPPPPPPHPAPPQQPAPQPHETWQTLGLESVSQFPAEKGKILNGQEIQKAYKKIGNGFTLESDATVNGEKQTITVNSRILNHWKIKNKNAQDTDGRMEVFNEVLRTLKNPEEVWEQPNGVRIYIRAVEIDGKRIYLNGVVVDPNNTVVSFIRAKSFKYADKKRYGKLLYKKR